MMTELEEWDFYDSETDVDFYTSLHYTEKEQRYAKTFKPPEGEPIRRKRLRKGPFEQDPDYPPVDGKKGPYRVVYGQSSKSKKVLKVRNSSALPANQTTNFDFIPTYKHWTFLSRNVPAEDDTVLRFHPYLEGDDPKVSEEDYLDIFEDRALVTTDWDADTIALRTIASRINNYQTDTYRLLPIDIRSHCQYVTRFKKNTGKDELIEAGQETDGFEFNEEVDEFFEKIGEELDREPRELMQLWLEREIEEGWTDNDTIGGEELCAWCAKYSCNVHAGRPEIDPECSSTIEKFPNPDSSNYVVRIPCSSKCFLAQTSFTRKDYGSIRKWTQAELQLLEDGREIFGNKVCDLAKFVGGGATCLEVWLQLKQPKLIRPGEVPEVVSTATPMPSESSSSSSESDSESSDSEQQAKSRRRRRRLRDFDPNFAPQRMHNHQPCNHPGLPCGDRCPCRHPALHHGCNLDPKNGPVCECRDQGVYCEKDCLCDPTCLYRYPGCNCENLCDTTRCRCYREGRECDPDLCGKAGAKHDKHCARCKNVGMLNGNHRRTKIGISQISGWGLFIMEKVRRHDFIGEYMGEIISWDEAERRGAFYDRGRNINYLFELNLDYQIDATRKGSKLRFINHSEKDPNCYPVVRLVSGEHRIGFYASRDLKPGDELFFDYGDHGKSVKFVAVERSAIRR